jgi:hypothetical protein
LVDRSSIEIVGAASLSVIWPWPCASEMVAPVTLETLTK